MHIRVVADEACRTYRALRECGSACVRSSSLRCVVRQAISPVLVLSDSRAVGARLVALLHREGVQDVDDETAAGLNASDHSAHSTSAAREALRMWTLFSSAKRRLASGTSTFSKSALLARPSRVTHDDFVVDARCRKKHASDGTLFTCRQADLWRDLV